MNRIEESEKMYKNLSIEKIRNVTLDWFSSKFALCLYRYYATDFHNNESSKNSGHEWASFIFKTRRRATSLYIEEAPLNQNNYVLG